MQSFLSILNDLIPLAATLVGSYVAVAGLNAWKSHLRGKTNYDTARRTLKAAYRVRDGLNYVRGPMITSGEYEAARKETGIERDTNKLTASFEENVAVYDRRWKTLADALSEFDLEALEAEVQFGSDFTAKAKVLTKCAVTLNLLLHEYFRTQKTSSPPPKRDNSWERVENVVYWTSDDPAIDAFSGEIQNAVAGIEEVLRKHL